MPERSFPDDLLQGYARFQSGRLDRERERYRTLAEEGQRPATMVIACCDSRAAPETVFDAGPGELFVMRNVANLVPPHEPDGGQHATLAAIEFAIAGLGVSRIVVMGHARCGGVAAALDAERAPLGPGDYIGQWIALLAPEAEHARAAEFDTPAERQTATERRAVRGSVERLLAMPQVAEAVREGRLAVHGAWFDIASGELWVMGPDGGFERAASGA